MVSQKKIALFVIGILIAGLLFYIIYVKKTFNNFSDLGALIQLQTSRPVGYINFYPENQNVYNNVLTSYGIPTNTHMKGVRKSSNGSPMIYPIPYPIAYPEDYPTQYPIVEYPMTRPYEEVLGPPYPIIDRT